MKAKVQPIPEGYNTMNVYLTVRNADKAIEYYRRAFGAKEVGRIKTPDGKVGHAELQIGNSRIMLADENEQWGNRSPESFGGSPVNLCLYVKDVDSMFNRAIQEGGKVKEEVKDQFHGDRSGAFIDPFGHEWTILTHIEELSFEELQRRSDALFATANQPR